MTPQRLEELRASSEMAITHREVGELFAEIDRLRAPNPITREEIIRCYEESK